MELVGVVVLLACALSAAVSAGFAVLLFNRKIDCLRDAMLAMCDDMDKDRIQTSDFHNRVRECLAEVSNNVSQNKLYVVCHPYRVVLEFSDGNIASRDLLLTDHVGDNCDIEILPAEDGKPELTVEYSSYCLVVHELDGEIALYIPVEKDFSLFRDRLVSGGWKIESDSQADDGGDDEVLQNQSQGQGDGL